MNTMTIAQQALKSATGVGAPEDIIPAEIRPLVRYWPITVAGAITVVSVVMAVALTTLGAASTATIATGCAIGGAVLMLHLYRNKDVGTISTYVIALAKSIDLLVQNIKQLKQSSRELHAVAKSTDSMSLRQSTACNTYRKSTSSLKDLLQNQHGMTEKQFQQNQRLTQEITASNQQLTLMLQQVGSIGASTPTAVASSPVKKAHSLKAHVKSLLALPKQVINWPQHTQDMLTGIITHLSSLKPQWKAVRKEALIDNPLASAALQAHEQTAGVMSAIIISLDAQMVEMQKSLSNMQKQAEKAQATIKEQSDELTKFRESIVSSPVSKDQLKSVVKSMQSITRN